MRYTTRMTSRERVGELVRGAIRSPDEPEVRGATAEELVELEARLGRRLPPELAEFLRICRGGVIGPGGVFGHRRDKSYVDLPAMRALYPEWQATDWLPIAATGAAITTCSSRTEPSDSLTLWRIRP